MKYTNKFLGALCLAAFGFASCADDYSLLEYDVEKPISVEAYEYLNDYKPLKEYVSNPDFKLGSGITVSEYNAGGLPYRVAVANFNELTAGNAMKHSSIVADNGSMDFGTVTAFVSKAQEAGQTIYGHTLAWHSQQRNKYLNDLLKDRELEVDPDATVEVEDFSRDFTTLTSWGEWSSKRTPTLDENGFNLDNPEACAESWEPQYHLASSIPLGARKYKVTVMMRGSAEGSINVGLGSWNGGQTYATLKFNTEWQELTGEINLAAEHASGFIMCQSGSFVGSYQIKWVKITHEEAAAVNYWESLISNGDAEGEETGSVISTHIGASNGPADIVDGVGVDGSRAYVIESAGGGSQTWDTQFFVVSNIAFEEGDKVKLAFDFRADVANGSESQAHADPGSYIYWDGGAAVSFTTEWQHFEKDIIINASMSPSGNMKSWAWNLDVGAPSAPANKYYIDNIVMAIERSGNSIPLTPQEKKDTLTWAMNNWISGMMAATGGYVTAWDVVNEPISGSDADGDGHYDLWSSKNPAGDNHFYWTDYLGDLDYVRTAVKQAREHFAANGGNAADLKLFINDFNLESDWDQNKKLKSLIYWIGKWEEDGETVIDGIGTQMHVSYYENPTTQASKEAAIENMFKLMAETGKLVKVSELDMGYVDANGNSVTTANMTEAQHIAMSEFYKFIIEAYFAKVPASQQYGITHWSPTDAPDSEGAWRRGLPIGLWDANYSRKHVYAGFAEGLEGK